MWFLRDMSVVTVAWAAYLVEHFLVENAAQFKICNN